MNQIVCFINPFLQTQTINIIKNGDRTFAEATLDLLPNIIIGLCYNKDIYDVAIKVLSVPDTFGEVIKENILEEELNHYTENKINIEVM